MLTETGLNRSGSCYLNNNAQADISCETFWRGSPLLPTEYPMSLILFCPLITILLACIISRIFSGRGRAPYVPGPRPDPIIGHLRLMTQLDNDEVFYKWHKQYGTSRWLFCYPSFYRLEQATWSTSISWERTLFLWTAKVLQGTFLRNEASFIVIVHIRRSTRCSYHVKVLLSH